MDEDKVGCVKCVSLLLKVIESSWGMWTTSLTVKETWVHHTMPEPKQQLKQWLKKGVNPPRKAKVTLSAKKVMAMLFYYSEGVVCTTYAKDTVNAKVYIAAVKKCNH